MQILQNLLSKFTPEDGTVNITVSFEEQRRIRLEVKDTGIGIEKKTCRGSLMNSSKSTPVSKSVNREQASAWPLTKKISELQHGSITVRKRTGPREHVHGYPADGTRRGS